MSSEKDPLSTDSAFCSKIQECFRDKTPFRVEDTIFPNHSCSYGVRNCKAIVDRVKGAPDILGEKQTITILFNDVSNPNTGFSQEGKKLTIDIPQKHFKSVLTKLDSDLLKSRQMIVISNRVNKVIMLNPNEVTRITSSTGTRWE